MTTTCGDDSRSKVVVVFALRVLRVLRAMGVSSMRASYGESLENGKQGERQRGTKD